MKFKKGDIIKATKTAKYSSKYPYLPEYEVKEIANGDLFTDDYYLLADKEGNRNYYAQENVDQLFKISLPHILKNL